MHKQCKILHINAETGWGGGEVQTLNLCRGLIKKGYQSILACPENSILSRRADSLGMNLELFKIGGFLGFATISRLVHIIQKSKPDIIHMHTAEAHYLGVFAAFITKVDRTVVTRRMDYFLNNNLKNRLAYGPGVKKIIAISAAVKDALISSGISEDKIEIIYSSINLEDFDYKKALAGNGKFYGKKIGAVANLYERKGIRYLIKAAAAILSKHPDTVFKIAGEGPLKNNLIEYTHECGVSNSFIFYGQLEDISSFLREIDIFVHPALKEGLGVAILEAMAMGKVVVASSVGGIKEVVVDKLSGILVPPADSSLLAQAIVDLIDQPDLITKMGECGYKIASEEFSVEEMISEYEKVYANLLL